MEKLALALVIPSQSGRLAKWAIKPSEYDIEYRTRTVAKGQVLADFLLELPDDSDLKANKAEELSVKPWLLHADGSSSKNGSRVGIRLTSPNGEVMEQSSRPVFKASNNEAEYGPLLAELGLAVGLKIRCLHAFSDSQLIVNPFNGDYDTKQPRMEAYLEIAKGLTQQFDEFLLTQIPRGGNTSADALAALASTSDPDLRQIIPVEFIQEPSINLSTDAALIHIPEPAPLPPLGPPEDMLLAGDETYGCDTKWMAPIRSYNQRRRAST